MDAIAKRLIRDVLVTVFGVSLMGALLVPAFIVFIQTVLYLRHGTWPALSVADSLLALRLWLPTNLTSWVVQPTSWYGLHQVVLQTPLALAIFVLGFALALLIGHGTDDWKVWKDHEP